MGRRFNGSSDSIANSNAAQSNTFSVVGWARINGTPGGNASFVNNGSTSNGYYMYVPSGTLNLHWVVPFRVDVDTTATITANAWVHLAMTYSGSDYLFYKNGVQVWDGGAFGDPLTADTGITIGSAQAANYWPGDVSDVAFWTVPLTAAEVLALTNGARPSRIRPASLVRFWPLDGLSSPEPDLSGGKFNGTLTGTTSIGGAPVNLLTRAPAAFIGSAVTAYTLNVNTGFYVVTGEAISLKAARKLVPNAGFYAYTGEAISLKAGRKLAVSTGFYSYTGEAITLKAARALSAATGFYVVTGEAVTARAGRKLAANAGFYLVTGEAMAPAATRKLSVSAGFYVYTGEAVTPKFARGMKAATGFYSILGQAVVITASGSFVMAADTGFYAVTGQAIKATAVRKMSVASGFYTYTGEAAGLAAGRKISVQAGFYVYTGESVGVKKGYMLAPVTGAYAVTGEPIAIRWTHVLKAATGFYGYTGQAVQLTQQTGVKIISTPGLLGFDGPVLLSGYDVNVTLKGRV